MDEVEANTPKANTDGSEDAPSNLPVVDEAAADDSKSAEIRPDKKESKRPQKQRQRSAGQRIWLWISHDTTSTDWLIVLLTAVIALTSYLQWREIHAGSNDTHDLAVQVKKQADAAKALADEMGESVAKTDKLIEQATTQAKATNRLAAATEESNANVVANDRPWIGVAMRIDEPELGKIPTVDISMINSGKRPAKVVVMRYQGNFFSVFPEIPPYTHQGPKSVAILIPNQPTSNKYNVSEQPITQQTMDILAGETSTLYLYMDVEYRTGKTHYTHACWEHLPKTKIQSNGFYSCPEYQDAN